jgi:hypothetical protein
MTAGLLKTMTPSRSSCSASPKNGGPCSLTSSPAMPGFPSLDCTTRQKSLTIIQPSVIRASVFFLLVQRGKYLVAAQLTSLGCCTKRDFQVPVDMILGGKEEMNATSVILIDHSSRASCFSPRKQSFSIVSPLSFPLRQELPLFPVEYC